MAFRKESPLNGSQLSCHMPLSFCHTLLAWNTRMRLGVEQYLATLRNGSHVLSVVEWQIRSLGCLMAPRLPLQFFCYLSGKRYFIKLLLFVFHYMQPNAIPITYNPLRLLVQCWPYWKCPHTKSPNCGVNILTIKHDSTYAEDTGGILEPVFGNHYFNHQNVWLVNN